MSNPSSKYLMKVESFFVGGVALSQMNFTTEQTYRTKLVYEAYQVWLENKQINPSKVLSRLAARDYPLLLERAAHGDAAAQKFVDAMNVRPGVERTVREIASDVYTLNWVISKLDVSAKSIERAKVVDASDWLIREGMKMGDARSVKSGSDLKMALFDNFKDNDDPASQMPNAEINITGDVSVIKRGRVNLSPEERKRIYRKYGLTDKQVTDMIQESNGTWVMPDEDTEEQDERDIFERNEDIGL